MGDFIWTEHDPPPTMLARSVGLGAYSFDCHWCSLYVVNATGSTGDKAAGGEEGAAGRADRAGGKASIAAEGRVHLWGKNASIAAEGRVNLGGKGVVQAPFRIPFDALLPKRTDLTNVLVPVACSSSHIRFNAIRMEPVWAIQGHAAGSAAAMALAAGVAVQDVDVALLQELLRKQKQKLEP